MKFFYEHIIFIRKVLIIFFLTIIILLLIMGRFRTMRIRLLGEEGHIFSQCPYNISHF